MRKERVVKYFVLVLVCAGAVFGVSELRADEPQAPAAPATPGVVHVQARENVDLYEQQQWLRVACGSDPEDLLDKADDYKDDVKKWEDKLFDARTETAAQHCLNRMKTARSLEVMYREAAGVVCDLRRQTPGR